MISVDPSQLASIWIYTVCKGRVYLGSAGQALMSPNCEKMTQCIIYIYMWKGAKVGKEDFAQPTLLQLHHIDTFV